MPELNIQESHDDGNSPKVLYLEGFLDSATSFNLQKKLNELITNSIFSVILDFKKISFLGSAGISVLLEYSSVCQSNGGSMVVCAVPEKARKVMSMVGVESIIRIFDTQVEAISFFHIEPGLKTAPEPEEGREPQELPDNQEASSIFPVKKICPHCSHSAEVPQSDIFTCKNCHMFMYIDKAGTVFSLEKEGDGSARQGLLFNLKVPSDIVYLNSIRAFLTSILGESGLSDDDTSDIEIGLDEAVSNVMEHAYGMDKTKQIEISFFLADAYILIKLRDTGKTFNLEEKIKEEELKVSSGSKRGRGCFIISQVMDRFEYQTIPHVGNQLTLLRYFKKPKITTT